MADYTYQSYEWDSAGSGNVTNYISSFTVSDADGEIAVGGTVTIAGSTFTVTSVIITGDEAGSFTAELAGQSFFFSQNTNLEASGGLNVPSQPGYTTTPGATVNLTCFLPGTLIATERGEVAIEDLVIGDRLPTADGSFATVRWVARQTVAAPFSPRMTTYPVCISAGALGNGLPRRDLFVSPQHALAVDGQLVTAAALVNDRSIYQVAEMPVRFQYLHIEVDGHRVIFAEGAATETYVDKAPRQMFDNWDAYQAMYPDWKPIPQMGLPIVEARRLLPAETRNRLAAIAKELGYAEKKVA